MFLCEHLIQELLNMLLDLKKIIKKYKIHNPRIIHIGAHQGDELSLYYNLQINKVLCFEPLKKF